MQRFGQKQQQNDGDELIYWIWLSKIPGMGTVSRRLLLDKFTSPKKIFEVGKEELQTVSGIGESKAEQIIKCRSLETAEKILMNCEKNRIRIMTLEDDYYPEYAKKILQMPTHLYYKGIPQRNSIGIAVVGARRCTREGKQIAIEEATHCVAQQIPVVSGMAKGIDSYAHTACLKAGGYTVAVLGNGLDICYPSEHNILIISLF